MAGVDSGIKVCGEACADIALLEKKKKAFIIMQIGKPEGAKVQKVITKMCMTNEEVDAAMAAGEITVNDKTVTLTLNTKQNETNAWCVFRSCLATFPIAYGSCIVDFKTKDGRDSDKLVFLTWNPDNATVKEKMCYSSTKVMNKFSSTPVKINQASDTSDLEYAEIEAAVRK